MKNWRHHLVPLLGLVIAALIGCHRQATPVPAGDTLTVAISTNTIHVGDLIQLRLMAVHGTYHGLFESLEEMIDGYGE